jgi:o-succinylbenzoate synthase
MQVRLHPYRIRLARTLREQTERVGILVSLTGADGLTGWGEAAPYPGLSKASLPDVERALAAWREDPAALQQCPEAQHGMRTALLDLEGLRSGQPVCQLLGPMPSATVPVSHLVTDPAVAAAAVAAGAHTLKLKVGDRTLDEDLARIDAIRIAVGPDADIRVDANRRWTLQTAQAAMPELDALGVDLVEEPTANPEEMRTLRCLGPRIAADESVRTQEELEKVIDKGWADAVVLKPMLIGAPEKSVLMAQTAASAGLGVLVTTTIDTWVGRRTALHIAATIPTDAVLSCGLMTGAWLADPLAADPEVVDGRVRVPTGPGLDLGAWRAP